MIHHRTHPIPVDGCNACRWASVSVAPSAMPTRAGGQQAVETNEREARWDRDMPAYKRLRRDKLQPAGIKGAADLEQVATVAEHVNTGLVNVKPRAFDAFNDTFGHGVTVPV